MYLTDASHHNPIKQRVIRVSPIVNGLVVGVLCGIALVVLTLFLVIRDGEGAGPHLSLIGQVFIGYKVTYVGAAIGFLWAFVVGGVAGYVGGWLYNAVAGRGGSAS